MNLAKTASLTLAIALCGLPIAAQSSKLDAAERAKVIKRIGAALEQRYVFPKVATTCRVFLEKAQASGDFDDDTLPSGFGSHLTQELQRITKDKHIRVRFRDPDLIREDREDPVAARARELRQMRATNYGFQRVERLKSNIGYLDLRGFASYDDGRDTAAAAMRLLHGSDAIVIDLRRNGGGSPAMVQFLCSYFFAEKTHLNSLYWREGDRTQEFWTLDSLPGPRMPDVPLFVLTSRRTFSAAEEFTYNLKTRERATIVGEITGGGANPGGMVPVGRRFAMFVPSGRAINPITKTNWEGVGVEPDLDCSADRALTEALELATADAAEYREQREATIQQHVEEVSEQLAAIEVLAKKKNWTEASAEVEGLLSFATDAGLWSGSEVNSLGYRYLNSSQPELAIAAFRFNAAREKTSNSYDSLGEAYMRAGKRKKAIENFSRSFKLDSTNTNAKRMLEKLAKPSGK